MLIEIPFENIPEDYEKARDYLEQNASMSEEMSHRMDGKSLVHLANFYMEAKAKSGLQPLSNLTKEDTKWEFQDAQD